MVVMATGGKTSWAIVLVLAIAGIAGGIADIVYHALRGELMEAIGTTPFENLLHGIPVAAIVIIFAVSLREVLKK